MTETQAVYHITEITPELLKAIRDVLTAGYGEVRVVIYQGRITLIEKMESVKVRGKDNPNMIQ
jgi:hypothetical protein